MGAATFLANYGRNASASGFRSLCYVIAGAEPVKAETRRLYAEKLGLRILEGYGVTEASPVLAVNSPAFNKIGTAGSCRSSSRAASPRRASRRAADSSSAARTS